eukprot:GHVQ01027756.1.p1 GENE.GHVQ01027756.1~~GHVQ01027756.1.p1  ORF type:complete len:416 (-),score=74.09 GHVQ01027756.1:1008-2255(-)
MKLPHLPSNHLRRKWRGGAIHCCSSLSLFVLLCLLLYANSASSGHVEEASVGPDRVEEERRGEEEERSLTWHAEDSGMTRGDTPDLPQSGLVQQSAVPKQRDIVLNAAQSAITRAWSAVPESIQRFTFFRGISVVVTIVATRVFQKTYKFRMGTARYGPYFIVSLLTAILLYSVSHDPTLTRLAQYTGVCSDIGITMAVFFVVDQIVQRFLGDPQIAVDDLGVLTYPDDTDLTIKVVTNGVTNTVPCTMDVMFEETVDDLTSLCVIAAKVVRGTVIHTHSHGGGIQELIRFSPPTQSVEGVDAPGVVWNFAMNAGKRNPSLKYGMEVFVQSVSATAAHAFVYVGLEMEQCQNSRTHDNINVKVVSADKDNVRNVEFPGRFMNADKRRIVEYFRRRTTWCWDDGEEVTDTETGGND